eukprot:gene62000-84791_t
MARLDLDDLPPKIAALLSDLPDGEELLLVQHGAVVGRLMASVSPAPVDPEDLIHNADLALYAAKNGGRGQFRFYSGRQNRNGNGGRGQF